MAESTTSGLSSSMTLFATAALAPGALRLADGVMMHVLPPRAVVRLQVSRPAMINVVDARIGHVALPTEPGQCIGHDPAILWLAPDGWLLVSEQWDGATLAAWVRPASHGRTAAVVDVSDSLVAFMLEGPRARELLTRGTGLDVDAASLVPGSCTRTRLAQLPVIVRSLTPERIELLVDRSPAAWLREWFIDAGGLL